MHGNANLVDRLLHDACLTTQVSSLLANARVVREELVVSLWRVPRVRQRPCARPSYHDT